MKCLACQKPVPLTRKNQLVIIFSLFYGFALSLLLFFIFKNRKYKKLHQMNNKFEAFILPKPGSSIDSTIPSKRKSDDLKLIFGIGPIISEYLNSTGILTFKELSNRDLNDLQTLLNQRNIRLNNAETWAYQAKLASENKWAELKNYQNNIKLNLRK